MNVIKRVVAALVCFVIVGWAIYTAATATPAKLEEEVPSNDSLVIWYTDDSLSDFMEAACVAYNEMYSVRVVPKLQSGDEYLEQVNKASIEDDAMPDLYVITNDMLERAYLGGLAHIVDTDVVNQNHFSTAALQAVTYRGNPVAYPFYFETSAMLYNRTYLFNMAQNQIMAEDSTEPDEEQSAEEDEASEEVEENPEADMTPEERIEYRIQQSLPDTFDELMEFADTYDAPMEVETVFKWDVKDIFYNYFFVGNYINIGGENGDDPSVIDIYNMNTITALTLYQDLNQFFSFDYEDISYESVLREFIEGKMVFTTATSDAIKVLEQAKADGEFEYDYGVMRLPQLSDNLTTRSMSVTNTVVVNGYTEKKETAASFAKFLTIFKAPELYNMSGKLSACNTVTYDDAAAQEFVNVYADSKPVPKMMATSNYWLQAEITFSNVWAGKNVSEQLKQLSEQIKEQVTGMDISEDYIDLPAQDTEEIQYYDEDAEREAAQGEGEEEGN